MAVIFEYWQAQCTMLSSQCTWSLSTFSSSGDAFERRVVHPAFYTSARTSFEVLCPLHCPDSAARAACVAGAKPVSSVYLCDRRLAATFASAIALHFTEQHRIPEAYT